MDDAEQERPSDGGEFAEHRIEAVKLCGSFRRDDGTVKRAAERLRTAHCQTDNPAKRHIFNRPGDVKGIDYDA